MDILDSIFTIVLVLILGIVAFYVAIVPICLAVSTGNAVYLCLYLIIIPTIIFCY